MSFTAPHKPLSFPSRTRLEAQRRRRPSPPPPKKPSVVPAAAAAAAGSELFPGEGPYVPSGLTPEEYQALKKKEADVLKSMDFGSWGPRFHRSDRPDGDWMVMPNLWTNGAVLRRNQQSLGTADPRLPWKRRRRRRFWTRNLPGWILAYALLDSLSTAVAMYQATELTLRQTAWWLLRISLFRPSASWLAATMVQVQAMKMSLAVLLTPTMNAYLERMNRRRLWGRRRTVLASLAAMSLLLVLWAGLLRLRGGISCWL